MANDHNKTLNLTTFFFLYIAQSIPSSFFATVIPVMMRQEAFSLSAIGLLQLIKLPWILKFFWSPWVDKHTRTVADYKRWIISSEMIYAGLILSVAFLNFHTDFTTIVVLVLLSLVASATQDIATDALAVRTFSHQDRSMVNSMQSMGSFGGSLIGSGLLLIIFHALGWNRILPLLALFVGVALLPLIFNKGLQLQPRPKEVPRAKWHEILGFFKTPNARRQTGFLFLYYAGLIGTLAMIKPWLVDLGYSMQQIGVMNGLAGTAMGFVAAFAGGMIMRRMGRHKARLLFSVPVLCTTLYFVMLSYLTPTTPLLYGGIFLLWGSYGLATIVVYTTAMDCVRPGYEGTDFTLQTVITHLSGMVMAVAGGKIADSFGYHGLFAFEAAIAAISLFYALYFFRKGDKINV